MKELIRFKKKELEKKYGIKIKKKDVLWNGLKRLENTLKERFSE